MVLNLELLLVLSRLLTNMLLPILRAYLETRKLKVLSRMRSELINKTKSISKRSRRRISRSLPKSILLSSMMRQMVKNIPLLKTMKKLKTTQPSQNGQNTTIQLNKSQKSKRNWFPSPKLSNTGRNSTKTLNPRLPTKTSLQT